jgi:hypothetical protein
MPQLFPFGQTVITATADSLVKKGAVIAALQRHAKGDWGDLDASDRKANDDALKNGSRLLSAYADSAGTKFWIITEWDRSVTTVLLPSDY